MQEQAKTSNAPDKVLIGHIVDEFVKKGNTLDEISKGEGFPESYPKNNFPLEEMQKYVMYHRMKINWQNWLKENYGETDSKESIYFIEGANWGDRDAYGAKIRNALICSFSALLDAQNANLTDVVYEISDEITEIFMRKMVIELRLNDDKRDYEFAIIKIEKAQIESLINNIWEFIPQFKKIRRLIDLMENFSTKLESFVEESKEIIYTGDYDNIKTLDNIIKDSNRLTTQYNELISLNESDQELIKYVIVSYEDNFISIQDYNIQTAENEEVELPYEYLSGTQGLKTSVDFLKELTHIARKEKESAESSRMNRALYRLQVIMTISLFTSIAALFSVSFSQIETNWIAVIVMIGFSAVLSWGTYHLINRK